MAQLLALSALTLAACAFTPYHVGRAAYLGDGAEYHSCEGGGYCREGYACVKDGCEFCGDEDGVETRCTAGTD